MRIINRKYLKRRMEKALERRKLTEALSHLYALIASASSPSDMPDLLKNHTVKGQHTLHYLAYSPTYHEQDRPQLERLIKIITDFGYDINKTSCRWVQWSEGNTALLASVKEQNEIYLECLFRQGARADICDHQGFSPCHWAIKEGNVKCMDKFFQHGLADLVTSAIVDKSPGDDKLHSCLHEAMDNGHLGIVRYLMTREELGADVKSLLMVCKQTVKRWIRLKMKSDKALEMGNLAKVLSHLDALILSASCSSHVRTLLRNHTVKDLPTLHFLVRFRFREEDIPHLDKLIKIFTDFGYDINKATDGEFEDIGITGSTALLASVEQRNLILLECLLRHGARTDLRYHGGFSAYHQAVKLGDLDCLQKLTQLGNSTLASAPFEKSGRKEAHPLLHTAVDQGRIEIVRYLLSKEELGVDVNEEAVYVASSQEESFDSWKIRFPEDFYRIFTPLGRALFTGNTPIIEVLVNHPGAKASRFKELYRILQYGDTEEALDLLKYFSDDELSSDKIEDQWPLNCLHPKALSEESRVVFTKKLILEYVKRGWDLNSVSTSATIFQRLRLSDGTEWKLILDKADKYNLLHLACFYEAPEIIKLLVEEARVDVNLKTEGKLELTPLQILLMLKEWESASYLIEKGADLNLRGNMESCEAHQFTWTMRKNLITGNLELDSTFNSVELLVRMGCDDGLALLDKVLARPEVKLHGANEFHLAMEGSNPNYCLKVLQHCGKVISKEDLNWMTNCRWSNGKNPVQVSSLISLFITLLTVKTQIRGYLALADLIKVMAELGCDLNISRYKPPLLDHEKEPLIFYILRYDRGLLLRTILQFDHLQLNVTNEEGESPVEDLLAEWDFRCSPRGRQSNRQPHKIVEAIQLLVTHGWDVSGVVIDRHFKYHSGSFLVLKMLYGAGAKILEEFFTSTNACAQFSGGLFSALAKEKQELKRWKDEFDRGIQMRLVHICGLQVRKRLKCVGDLKMLDELPKSLKVAVLGTTDEPTFSRTVSVCEQGFESIDDDD